MGTLALTAIASVGLSFLLICLLPSIAAHLGLIVHLTALELILLLHVLAVIAGVASTSTPGYLAAATSGVSLLVALYQYRRFRGERGKHLNVLANKTRKVP